MTDVALLLTYHMLLISIRRDWLHSATRDALGDLAALAYKDIIREPIVHEGSDTVPALIADLGIRGVEALFDI